MNPILKIVSKESIKPNTPTCQNLRNFKVSFLDQLSPSSYIPTILFFNNPNLNEANHHSKIISNLKDSLSEALAIYYPLAGKLKDSISIDCNDEGALFIEAQVNNCSLNLFLESPNISSLNNFLPVDSNSLEENPERYLIAIQITKFQCGGIVIGSCMFHKVVDTVAISCFLDTWAKISRNSRDQVTYPDLFSGSKLFPPRDPVPSEFLKKFNEFFFTKSNSMKRFVFDAKSIANLKAQAASEEVPYPSRVVALTAFICKRILATTRDKKYPEALMVSHPVNIRQHLEPLNRSSFGNLIWLSYTSIDNDSGKNIELSSLAALVREMLVNVNGENLKGLDYDEVFSSLGETVGEINKSENVKVLRFTSWCNLGFYDLDFGWGKPVWISDMGGAIGFLSKQHFLFVDCKCGKEIELWMACDEDDISALENDPEFIACTIPNPGVCMHY